MIVDQIFVYGVTGLAAGVLCLVLAGVKRRTWPEHDFSRAVTCFLAAPGLIAAVGIIREGLTPSPQLRAVANNGEIRLYLVLGGFALAWVSLAAVGRELQASWKGTVDAQKGVEADDTEQNQPPPGWKY